VLARAGLTGADQNLAEAVKVRHGHDGEGKRLHFYFNFSGQQQSVPYGSADGSDLLTDREIRRGQTLTLSPWDLAIVLEYNSPW